MAHLRPFRAVRYDARRVGALAGVVAPPYDVIDPTLRAVLAARSPHNFVHVDLPVDEPGEAPAAKYDRAAALFRGWMADGVLRRDETPGLYVYEQTFEVAPGRTTTRRGFLGVVELADYAERVILPHERTLSGPKEDRMRLMVATEAQLSQLFLLYDDPEGAVDRTLAAARTAAPLFDATTDDQIHHVVWRVTDAAAISTVTERLAPERLLIADGHHRYETALAYRDDVRARRGPGPHDFALAYFANSADPGLTVWPTHRALHDVADFSYDAWLLRVGAHFDVEHLGVGSTPSAVEAALAESGRRAPSFAALRLTGGGVACDLLRLDHARSVAEVARIPGPEAARRLDVNILHDFVLPALTGISLEAQAAKAHIHYIKGLDAAFAAAADPAHDVVLLMNPLPVPLVRAVCESGGFMPQKSTFFYPKVLSGLVVNDLTSW